MLGLLFGCPSLLSAQTYGNEWISYDQQYLRLKVGADGIYKLTAQEMERAGFPVAQINPKTLQLFHRGQEQAIHVEGEGDEVLNSEDFVLFYGRKNDGTLDKELYLSPDLQPHNYYNQYSDSSAYFLTFRLAGSSAGKRMNIFSGTNTTNLNPEPYYWDEKLTVLSDSYSAGEVYGAAGNLDTYLTYGDKGEGWSSAVLANNKRDFTLTGLTDAYTAGPAPTIGVQFMGRNSLERTVTVEAGATTAGAFSTIKSTTFTGYSIAAVQENLPWNVIANNQTVIRTTFQGRGSVNYIQLRYPRLWKMGTTTLERKFQLEASNNPRYIEITDVPDDVILYDISDSHNVRRISFQREGSSIKAMIPASGSREQVLLLSGVQAAITKSKPVSFRQFPSSGAEYLIVSNQLLMQPGGGYDNPVEAYGAYRASAEGGGFNTLTVEMQELYDQFSYGEITPLAIRKFVLYSSQEKLPQYLFLIGKSLSFTSRYFRNTNWTNINRDLVPTFGNPGGDIPFVAQMNGSGYGPAFPVGRLSVRTPEEVAAYLKKVIEDENSSPNDLWLKRILHLGGGNSVSQALQLKSYLRVWENIAEGPFLGAEVTTLSKTEDLVVQEIDVSKDVNRGTRLITFFGHSGTDLADLEIGFASVPRYGYNNKGMYSRILVNGCEAGNIFSTNKTFGEDWLFTPDKGAVNFIAHSYNGYTNLLYQYSSNFYRVAVTDENFLGASIGKIQQEAVRRFLSGGFISPLQITQAQQMVLQGDPALVLFAIEQADFETNNDHIAVRPLNNQPLNMSADSIAVDVIVRNFGKAVTDSLQVQLEYWLEDGTPQVLELVEVPAIYRQDTVTIHLATNQLEGPGRSSFRITLNPASEIPEKDYTNNTGTLEVVVPAGGTLNLLPQNYAVVHKNQIKLITQGIDALRSVRGFSYQLDTAYHYNSASLQQSTVQSRFLASWSVTLPEIAAAPADTIVYYWKSQLTTPSPTEDTAPSKSSFTYIKDAPDGWAQAHEGQFSENRITSLKVEEGRRWSYTPIQKAVKVTTFGAKASDTDYREVELAIDGVQLILNQPLKFCSNNTMNAVQLDKNTLGIPGAKLLDILRSESCGRMPQVINNFSAANINNGDNDTYNLERFLKEVPEGDWIVLFSIGLVNYTQWPASVKQQVASLGVEESVLNQLANGEPIAILGKKGGAPGTAVLAMVDKSEGSLPINEQIIELNATVSGAAGVGFVESGLIGPATSWQDVAIRVAEDDADYWKMKVIGVNANSIETTVAEITQSGTTPLTVSATEYPYLRLRLEATDTVKLSPPQLKFWRVGFESLPEGVLVVHDSVQRHNTLDEGKLLRPGFRFVNISEKNYAADSLEVVASLLNVNSRKVQQLNTKIKSPAPGDTARFALPITTSSFLGVSDLSVKVNPRPMTELTLQNNVLDAKGFLTVRSDSLHPFIDVAFDGSYITNGEIVRPDPLISVIMRDENKFLPKQDTTGIHLYLKRQCENCTFERINLSNPSVRFYPASRQEDYKIEFTPGPLEDGMYTLQVQAEDASGNKAGTRPYAISFEVISESSLTHFYPYPNPFSTSTRFVFTLTGNEVPDDLKIQIMTVSGKVIREIMKEELGPLRIGHNQSQYAWDGTDEWGDRLANGVYLYRVVLGGANAAEWKHRATKGDKAFRQEFGKLYILR
ncbi:hypothetical protein D770_24255 [Flammeovirgaceae bacterium 311]|nr:hypothetical protein D770_24255 [Flammeovirgaceae bacterium 311]